MKQNLEKLAKFSLVFAVMSFMWFFIEALSFSFGKEAGELVNDSGLRLPMLMTGIGLFISIVSLNFSKSEHS